MSPDSDATPVPDRNAAPALPGAFAGSATDYDLFMGRYAASLASALLDALGSIDAMRVLDVGCGPGALARAVAARGAATVAALDPAPKFAAACQARVPTADVRVGFAEQLPWPDNTFDAALSSLVIGFMSDPDQSLREMRRVTRPGGAVALCMWDITGGGMTMLHLFWTAVHHIDPAVAGEAGLPGSSEGDIARRLRGVGLHSVTDTALTANGDYTGFQDLWESFSHGIGPAGQYLASVPAEQHDQIRDDYRTLVPNGPFTLDARAWYAVGHVP